jgi:hypothetical protein
VARVDERVGTRRSFVAVESPVRRVSRASMNASAPADRSWRSMNGSTLADRPGLNPPGYADEAH